MSLSHTQVDEKPKMSKQDSKKLCQECKRHVFLYQCPRCSRRTCSLECCKSHKSKTGCNGKRDRTVFVPLSRMDDSTLDSDYHFLEDVLGKVESGQRLLKHAGISTSQQQPHKRTRTGTYGDSTALHEVQDSHAIVKAAQVKGPLHRLNPGNLHPQWRHFQQVASDRGVQILFMPTGMLRHKSNKSHVKKDTIYWNVEWNLHPLESKEPVAKYTSLVAETTLIIKALESLDLRSTDVSLLIKRLPAPSNQPKYNLISDDMTLQLALKDMTVIEYPTIEIVPRSRLSEFPQVIEAI